MSRKLAEQLRSRSINPSPFTTSFFDLRFFARLLSSTSSTDNARSHTNATAGPHQLRKNSSSLKEPELAKFAAIADSWWDPEGPFKPLHLMNPTRLAFIRSALCRHFRCSAFDLIQLPKGTHQWSSFLTPEELVLILGQAGIDVSGICGFLYDPLRRRWFLSDDLSVTSSLLAQNTSGENNDSHLPE
ncbi:ubiquinone biosynthesis O-methyltransferase, mitochondrial [Carica papaya]|uniref:ubiquinone biosynthesis O-methyltransferase, mitochondrial n=1 Tax=Carica papaya TaxID=3649 RepID=UPI000B8CBB8A|nr:ubiquinone biosynthesis O-methyltransferase, mitochondrial [Carica papaya]